ncbi:hypothetical protein K504DRAFT_104160 [Pleomassaria siparia CBS 279.74]|uniref:Rhodopsin domain-containing protein n=1 Tax=Pleomassaria siparia CBS 279.74 TaxID=1314801 RepID=A0A6G1JXN5_9PLEO|nr:hypothetical protein K504DRAFT_104160 [Pleomassaria siparia CBS 279.74]
MENSKDPSTVPNRGPVLVAVNITFVTAALLANVLRCFVRLHLVRAFGIDDWLMVVATVAFATYCSFSIAGVHFGTGRHHVDLSIHDITTATNCWWYCYLFYCISMICSKVSIGCLLLRIAVRRLHFWICYGAISISMVAGATFFFVTMFQCKPISFFWNKDQHGSCIASTVIVGLAYLYSTFSIISDFTFALLPGFLVWNLQLKNRTKLALIPLLTMGCIASSAVIARLPYLSMFNSPDFLWDTFDIAIWSSVEQGLAITAGSLATLRPLFHLAAHKFGISTHSRTRASNYGGPSPFSSQVLQSPRRGSNAKHLDTLMMSSALKSQPDTQSSTPSHTSPEYKEYDISFKKPPTQHNARLKSPNSPISPMSPGWYKPLPKMGSGLRSHRGSPVEKGKIAEDSESTKSLTERSLKNSKETLDQDGMRIMVKKSFSVTDEQRP